MRFLFIALLYLTYHTTYAYKLTPFIPNDNKTGVGVIICPGGSYFWLDKQNEGHKVAQWLCENGITAFVLEYSHGGWASFAFHFRTQGRSDWNNGVFCWRSSCHACYGTNGWCQ